MANSKPGKLTLKNLGYHFVKEPQGDKEVTVLREKATGEKFKFDFYKDKSKNQERYEELAEAVKDYVHEVCLERNLKLLKTTIPVEAGENEPKGFFFRSEYALHFKKLVIFLHGDGAVRAGQWARRLIINENLESGTMVPYIERALKEGYGVILANGNYNRDSNNRPIQGSESAEDHFVYVWNKFIKNANAKHIVIVAHSLGGEIVLHGLKNIDEAMRRIKAVALTHSTHTTTNESETIKKWLKEKAKNWVVSEKPLDTPVKINCQDDCDQVSAGTMEHVKTSHCALESVFNFFEEKLNAEDAHPSFVKPTQFNMISQKYRPDKLDVVYKMTSSPRGLAVIVIMEHFEPQAAVEDLEGTGFDAEGLQKLFEGLDFRTKKLVDLTKAELMQEFQDISSYHFGDYDCLVVCISSHGDEGFFLARDGEKIEIQSIHEAFNNRNCETLCGKPKLFFIDACRGDSKDPGTEVNKGGTISSKPQPSPKRSPHILRKNSSRASTGENADMLIAFSSFKGYCSFLKTDTGSWFFYSLVEVFRKYAGEEDVMSMLTRVNKEVNSEGDLGLKQVPQPTSTLNKSVFFWPGMKFELV